MAKLHFIVPTSPIPAAVTVRLGTAGPANNFSTLDEGKIVRLTGESAYSLTAVGEEFEGFIQSVETATSGGFSIGGIVDEGAFNVTFDGLQGTPGVGVVAIGDYVVSGTQVARGTALALAPRVCKATAAPASLIYKWRVVSLGLAGTGAVGTAGVVRDIA